MLKRNAEADVANWQCVEAFAAKHEGGNIERENIKGAAVAGDALCSRRTMCMGHIAR